MGANVTHHSEIDLALYQGSKIYTDSLSNAATELKTLDCPIEAEVGEIISGSKKLTKHTRTIYHSLGTAVADAVVAQIVETLYHKQK